MKAFTKQGIFPPCVLPFGPFPTTVPKHCSLRIDAAHLRLARAQKLAAALNLLFQASSFGRETLRGIIEVLMLCDFASVEQLHATAQITKNMCMALPENLTPPTPM